MKVADLGGSVSRDPATDLLTVNREFTACIVLSRCQLRGSGRNHWKMRFDTSLLPDITVAVKLDQSNSTAPTTTCFRTSIFGSLVSASPTGIRSSSRAIASTRWTTYTVWHSVLGSGEEHDSA